MTRAAATLALLGRFEVGAKVVDYAYDPAGSDTSYVPSADDVAIVQAFLDRELVEKDFYFMVGGGHSRCRYGLSRELVEEIGKHLDQDV